VIDNVARSSFREGLKLRKRGGRNVSSGAIGGALVTMDKRTVDLRDLSILGCTALEDAVFANLVSYVERGELRPQVAREFPLKDIARDQQEFLKRADVGKFRPDPAAPDLMASRLGLVGDRSYHPSTSVSGRSSPCDNSSCHRPCLSS
jgi:D-arabinose 1-dehydrogenase-like Zn-dependent alcohol dehydrogenase